MECTRPDGHSNKNDKISYQRNGYVKSSDGHVEPVAENGILENTTLCVCKHCLEDKKCRFDTPPLLSSFLIYLSYFFLVSVGYIREILLKFGLDADHVTSQKHRDGYVPLYQEFTGMYNRHLFRRVKDCLNRPVYSAPGAEVVLKDRDTKDYCWSFQFTGGTTKYINMGSYNYLGFAQNKGYCNDYAKESIKKHGISYCSSRRELGTSDLHEELEQTVARFVGSEAAITFGMGFATNSMNIPALVGKGCLILSDQMNHASLVLGARLSEATIRVFKHNNMADLEKKLREAVVDGQPRTRRPWKKILIVVEGVYSMEGDIVKLRDIVRLKKKYKAYLYLDEAHSIGAMGARGRGVVDYWKCDPKDIDVMMGTFTKSFNACGGYLAGTEKLIRHLKATSHAQCYASGMSPPVTNQIIASMRVIMGEVVPGEGARLLKTLALNTRYIRRQLKKKGFTVYGDEDSPVVPLMLYYPSKIPAFVRGLTDRQILTVGVGFPAVSLVETRARFCMSAAHTKEMLDRVIEHVIDVGHKIGLNYHERPHCDCPIEYEDEEILREYAQ